MTRFSVEELDNNGGWAVVDARTSSCSITCGNPASALEVAIALNQAEEAARRKDRAELTEDGTPQAEPKGESVSPVVEFVTVDNLGVCSWCLDGRGGECHTPGCVFIYNRAPDIPLRPNLVEVHGARISATCAGQTSALAEALRAIIRHQEIVGGPYAKALSTTARIAKDALAAAGAGGQMTEPNEPKGETVQVPRDLVTRAINWLENERPSVIAAELRAHLAPAPEPAPQYQRDMAEEAMAQRVEQLGARPDEPTQGPTASPLSPTVSQERPAPGSDKGGAPDRCRVVERWPDKSQPPPRQCVLSDGHAGGHTYDDKGVAETRCGTCGGSGYMRGEPYAATLRCPDCSSAPKKEEARCSYPAHPQPCTCKGCLLGWPLASSPNHFNGSCAMPCTAYAPAPAPEAHFHAAPGGGVYPCKEACPAPEPSNSMHDRLKALEERVAELEEWRNRPRSVR